MRLSEKAAFLFALHTNISDSFKETMSLNRREDNAKSSASLATMRCVSS